MTEDPVCGPGRCHIVSYWAERLDRAKLTACQTSRRGGTLYGRMNGEQVWLARKAVLFSAAELRVD